MLPKNQPPYSDLIIIIIVIIKKKEDEGLFVMMQRFHPLPW